METSRIARVSSSVPRGLLALLVATAVVTGVPSVGAADQEAPASATGDGQAKAPSPPSPKQPSETADKRPRPPANPDALEPINSGTDAYDEPIGGDATRATAPEPGVIGNQRAYVAHTTRDWHVMVGAGQADGQQGVPTGSGAAVDFELNVVSKQRIAFSIGATYLKILDENRRRLITVVARGGYRLWGHVHGRAMGFAPKELLVRTTRSSLFAIGSINFLTLGSYVWRDEDGDLWNAPDDSTYPGVGLTYELRRENTTITVSAEALRELVGGEWGTRGRVRAQLSRYTAGLTYSNLTGVLKQTHVTAGLVF